MRRTPCGRRKAIRRKELLWLLRYGARRPGPSTLIDAYTGQPSSPTAPPHHPHTPARDACMQTRKAAAAVVQKILIVSCPLCFNFSVHASTMVERRAHHAEYRYRQEGKTILPKNCVIGDTVLGIIVEYLRMYALSRTCIKPELQAFSLRSRRCVNE